MITKEHIFSIMGKYYGNAYYRDAIRMGISEHDLVLIRELLDTINKLGYNFSNLHAVSDIEDIRLVPIILENYNRFESENIRSDLLGTIRFPSYVEFVPRLIELYENESSPHIRENISQSLFHIRSQKYVSEYLRLVNKPHYGETHDYLIDLLCRLKVMQVKTRLLSLLEDNEYAWRWTFLKYIHIFKDPSLCVYIQSYLNSEDYEIKAMAKKALRKLDSMM